jgi:hypothetical protein
MGARYNGSRGTRDDAAEPITRADECSLTSGISMTHTVAPGKWLFRENEEKTNENKLAISERRIASRSDYVSIRSKPAYGKQFDWRRVNMREFKRGKQT